MKAYFITWSGHAFGIRNSPNGTFIVGDRRNTFTVLDVAEQLQDKDTLTDIAIRSTPVRRSRHDREPACFTSRIIPCSRDDRRAVVLTSFMVRKRSRGITWWSVRAPECRRAWMERNGLSLNGYPLWEGIDQYGYGIRHDPSKNAIVRRLLVLSERSGFIVQDGNGWAFCVYWNGYHLDQTGLMPLPYLQEQVNRVL